jgi:hypothetical protein
LAERAVSGRQAARFELSADAAKQALADVVSAGMRRQYIALTPEVGMAPRELEPFAPTFEQAELQRARGLI